MLALRRSDYESSSTVRTAMSYQHRYTRTQELMLINITFKTVEFRDSLPTSTSLSSL